MYEGAPSCAGLRRSGRGWRCSTSAIIAEQRIGWGVFGYRWYVNNVWFADGCHGGWWSSWFTLVWRRVTRFVPAWISGPWVFPFPKRHSARYTRLSAGDHVHPFLAGSFVHNARVLVPLGRRNRPARHASGSRSQQLQTVLGSGRPYTSVSVPNV